MAQCAVKRRQAVRKAPDGFLRLRATPPEDCANTNAACALAALACWTHGENLPGWLGSRTFVATVRLEPERRIRLRIKGGGNGTCPSCRRRPNGFKPTRYGSMRVVYERGATALPDFTKRSAGSASPARRHCQHVLRDRFPSGLACYALAWSCSCPRNRILQPLLVKNARKDCRPDDEGRRAGEVEGERLVVVTVEKPGNLGSVRVYGCGELFH